MINGTTLRTYKSYIWGTRATKARWKMRIWCNRIPRSISQFWNYNSNHGRRYGTHFKRKQILKTLTSIGSTSWAMTTNWAFFCSINLVTVLVPAFNVFGRFFGWTSLPLALASAIFFKRCFLANEVSGRYFSSILNNCTAVCLSNVWLNWLIGGGIFKRFCKTAFCLWTRMYFGHLTKRAKSRFGWMFWPAKQHQLALARPQT